MSVYKFMIGNLVVTKAAEQAVAKKYGYPGGLTRLASMLARHAMGDWGDLNAGGKQHNDEALIRGGQLFSVYEVAGTDLEFWIITEADRSKTTIMLPTDF